MRLSKLDQKFDFEFPVIRNLSNTLARNGRNRQRLKNHLNITFINPSDTLERFVVLDMEIYNEFVENSVLMSVCRNGKYNQAHVNRIKRAVNNFVKQKLKDQLEMCGIPKYLHTALYLMISNSQDYNMKIASLKIFNRVCIDAGVNPLQKQIKLKDVLKKKEKDLTIDEIGMKIKRIKNVG